MYRQEETETNRIKETHILYKHTHTHVYDFTEMQNSMTTEVKCISHDNK